VRLRETLLPGAFVIEPEPYSDERGLFARTYDRELFVEWGLDPEISQTSTSFNVHTGTLRGMHFQTEPFAETKLVRCTQGALYDVIVDLRPGSPTYCRWEAIELTAADRLSVYVPKGVAHGFQTLVDGTEILYAMSSPFRAEYSAGVRYDDPAFRIEWPQPAAVVSEKDASYPDFAP
jgi:dTDP-4-dehydrorhamnose 3,5-epimerase